MENGGIRKLNIFGSALQRGFTSRTYMRLVFCTAFLSLTSVYLLKSFVQETRNISDKLLEVFRSGEGYNIGIFSIMDLDILHRENCDDILRGILSGTFSQLLCVGAATSFVCSEYRNGYIRIALIKGIKRQSLCIYYMAISILIVLPLLLIYVLGIICSLAMNGYMHIQDGKTIIMIMCNQIIMLSSFCACVGAFSLVVKEDVAKVISMISVIVLPMLPAYIKILTRGRVSLEKWLLLSQIAASVNAHPPAMLWNSVLSILSVMMCGIICIIYCYNSRYL